MGAGRPGWHSNVEDDRHIDVRRWQRDGLLTPGREVWWTWRDPESLVVTASINFSVGADVVHLQFSADGNPVRQSVRLDRRACNFGGTRPWFGCPTCDRRVALLYMANRRFACRSCHNLVYKSQSEDDIDRASRKLFKVEAKLGESRTRPKGMRQGTYRDITRRIRDCEQERRITMLNRCMKYLGR